MEGIPFAENAEQRDRLATVARLLNESDLSGQAVDGSAVAAILGHIAFWDRWAQCLIHRWRSGQMPPPSLPDWYDDAVNETLRPQWRALAPAVAATLAADAARGVDHELSRLETPVLNAIMAAGESNLLRRHRHRRRHLDEVERLLNPAGG